MTFKLCLDRGAGASWRDAVKPAEGCVQKRVKCAGVCVGNLLQNTEFIQSLDKHLSACVPGAVLGAGGRNKADALYPHKAHAV